MKSPINLKLVVDNYIGRFYIRPRNGHGWKKKPIHQIGNAGVALDVVDLLSNIGHKVKIEYINREDD